MTDPRSLSTNPQRFGFTMRLRGAHRWRRPGCKPERGHPLGERCLHPDGGARLACGPGSAGGIAQGITVIDAPRRRGLTPDLDACFLRRRPVPSPFALTPEPRTEELLGRTGGRRVGRPVDEGTDPRAPAGRQWPRPRESAGRKPPRAHELPAHVMRVTHNGSEMRISLCSLAAIGSGRHQQRVAVSGRASSLQKHYIAVRNVAALELDAEALTADGRVRPGGGVRPQRSRTN
jgi:hypothetical protein